MRDHAEGVTGRILCYNMMLGMKGSVIETIPQLKIMILLISTREHPTFIPFASQVRTDKQNLSCQTVFIRVNYSIDFIVCQALLTAETYLSRL